MQYLTTSGRARVGLRSRTLMRTIVGLVGFAAPLMGQAYNINTFAGSGPTCTIGDEHCTTGSAGDNGPAASAQLSYPQAVAIDNNGNVYIADTNNFKIRKVTSGGTITTIAGNGTAGYTGDNGAATSATITRVKGIAVDNNGNVYIADSDNSVVRKISGGTITTIAGTGVSGYSGDNGPATNAKLSAPVGVAVDTQNNVYIADLGNARVRKVSNGTITTVAGNGGFGSNGDGGQATNAAIYPYGVAVDSNGNLYIAESATERVRKVTSNGVINTIAGNGTIGYSGDGGQATAAQLDTPSGVSVDSAGQVFIVDTVNDVVRKVATNGVISTVAGTANTAGYSGDNGSATGAQLNLPYGIGIGPSSNTVYIADTSNNRIRALTPGTSTAPFGSFDTPANNSTGAGAVNVTGWALSQPAISTVGIYREPISGETPGSNGLVFLSNAALVPGARPDVAAAYPGFPNNNWGWGVQVLTNELPGTGGQGIGNGTYRLHVIAMNSAGASTDLGTKTITAANATSVLPFGTIDTPAPGAVASGTNYVNFGWAVTPVTSNVIPKDGSTITVYIDNQPVGHPTYNQFRSDIAMLFPGLQNSQGAVGFYTIDTTKLANGIHTIAWVAVDSAGNAQGLGSRQFTVQN